MKKIKYLLATMLLGCSTMSFAQFNSGSSSSSSSSHDVEAWRGLRVSYDRTFMNYDKEYDYWNNYNGFSVSYVQSVKIAPKLPIFFETGIGFNFAKFKIENWTKDADYTSTFMGLTIPVNFVYAAKANEYLTIKPYTGFFLRVNVLGEGKVNSSDYEDVNYFDDDDMGGWQYTWERCQFGWQVGVMMDFNNFNVGIGYALDFNEIAKDLKASKFSATIGLNF